MKEEGGGIVFTLCIFQMPCDLLFLTLALDYLKKKQKRKKVEDCWEEQLTAGSGVEEWKTTCGKEEIWQ